MYIGTFDNHGIHAKWEIVGKLCDSTAMRPMPDQARQFAADELPINLDLVESDKNQILGNRVWIKFRLPVWQISHASQEM